MSTALARAIEERDTLAEENRQLREEIEELRRQMLHKGMFPPEWGLTPVQTDILRLLIGPMEIANSDAIASMLPRGVSDEFSDYALVKVHIFKMRQKLKAFGIEIRTVWGRGYMITKEEKERIRSLMER